MTLVLLQKIPLFQCMCSPLDCVDDSDQDGSSKKVKPTPLTNGPDRGATRTQWQELNKKEKG